VCQQRSRPHVHASQFLDAVMAGIWAEGVGHKLVVGRLTHSDEHAAQARLEIRVGRSEHEAQTYTSADPAPGWAWMGPYTWFCLAKRVKPKFLLFLVLPC
jgi:hypothetical protein